VNQQFDDEIDLREYIDVVVRRWKLVLLFAVIVPMGAFIFSVLQKPVYEGKTTILLRNSGPSLSSKFAGVANLLGMNAGGSSGNLGDLTELMQSRAVAEKVLDDLNLTKRIKGWDNPKIKRASLAAAVSKMLKPVKTKGGVWEITTKSNYPKLAADLANAYVAAIAYYWQELNYSEAQKKLKYIESELPRVEEELKSIDSKLKLVPRSYTGMPISGQSNIQRDYDIYSASYTMLKKELESTRLDASKELPPFSVIDAALVPDSPVFPKIKLNVMIGVVLGLFLGIFIVFFQEYWEKSGGKK